jgi:hypothetical protein
VTSAHDEAVPRGGLGPLGVELLYDTVDAVRRLRSFPPPPGYQTWDVDAVHEVAHEFVASDAGRRRIAGVLLRASDDESFERLLEAAVRNFMRSELRKTSQGRAMRALRRIVDDDPEVTQVPAGQPGAGAWCLPDYLLATVFAGHPSVLIEAAFAVDDVRRARWRPDAQHRTPIAEGESLRRVVRSVLGAAAAPVSQSQMLAVVLERFPLVDAPSVIELDGDVVERAADGDRSAAALIAGEIWDELSDNERLVVGCLDETVRDIAAETGLSKSSAHRAAAAAQQALAELLGEQGDPLPIVTELRRLSTEARNRGTERAGLAFTHDEET